MEENSYLKIRRLHVLAKKGEIEPEEYGERCLKAINRILSLEKGSEEKEPTCVY
jgi:hypothetical protein